MKFTKCIGELADSVYKRKDGWYYTNKLGKRQGPFKSRVKAEKEAENDLDIYLCVMNHLYADHNP